MLTSQDCEGLVDDMDPSFPWLPLPIKMGLTGQFGFTATTDTCWNSHMQHPVQLMEDSCKTNQKESAFRVIKTTIRAIATFYSFSPYVWIP